MRTSAPKATPSGPAESCVTSFDALPARLVNDDLIEYASPVKPVAATWASMAASLGPKGLTLPLLSSGISWVSRGIAVATCSRTLLWL